MLCRSISMNGIEHTMIRTHAMTPSQKKRPMLKPKHDLITAGRLLILALIVTMTNTVRAEAASSSRVEPAQIVVVEPFQIEMTAQMNAGTNAKNLDFAVPPGKTLVIEYVSGDCIVPAGQACVLAVLTEGPISPIEFNLQTDLIPFAGEDIWRAGQQVQLYTKTGGTLRADRSPVAGSATIRMSLSGHLQ
jgi:hypothetical protein